jgi:hypothetical protein
MGTEVGGTMVVEEMMRVEGMTLECLGMMVESKTMGTL